MLFVRMDLASGRIAPGLDANLLIVDGDPTRDIAATERISSVVLKGERVRRIDLFDAAKNPLQRRLVWPGPMSEALISANANACENVGSAPMKACMERGFADTPET